MMRLFEKWLDGHAGRGETKGAAGSATGESPCSASSYRHRLVGMIAILVALTGFGTFVLDGEPNPREVQATEAPANVKAPVAANAGAANLVSPVPADSEQEPVTSTAVKTIDISPTALATAKQDDVAVTIRPKTLVSTASYVLQLAALHDVRSAEKICRALREIKNRCHVQQSSAGANQVFRVRFGPLGTKERARELKARIALEGFASTIVRIESANEPDHGA